jgi:hypothetical protein
MRHQHTTIPAELTDGLSDEWMAAFIATTRAVENHPLFPRLVREVAVAEAPGRPHFAWLRRNSRTYGIWINRDQPGGFSDSDEPIVSHGGRKHPRQPYAAVRTRRAYLLCRVIASELDNFTGWRLREADAAVYVTARWHVQHRSSGRDL